MAAAVSSKQSGRIAQLLNLKGPGQAVDEVNLQYLSGAIQRAKEKKLDAVEAIVAACEAQATGGAR